MPPTIAEQLIGVASQTAQNAPDLQGAVTKGMELAQHAEKLRQQRQQIEQQKQEVAAKKDEHLFKMYEAGMKMSEKEQKLFFAPKGPFRNARDGMGKTEEFPDDKINWITATPENMSKAYGVIRDVREGLIDRETAIATIFDETKYPDLNPYIQQQFSEDVTKAADAYVKDKSAKERSIIQANAAMGRQMQGQAAAPQVQYNEKVASEGVKFNAQGGEPGLLSKINKIDNVIAQLKSGKIKTRTTAALVTSALGGRGQGALLPAIKAAKADVNSAIDIKKILDSQFSDAIMKETQQNLGFDENLTEEDNIRRLTELSKTMKAEVAAKRQELERLGLYRPQKSVAEPPKFDDTKKKQFGKLPSAEQRKVIDRLVEQTGATAAEIKKALGL